MLNVQHGVQASIVEVGGDRRMPVFSRLNDRGVESYKMEEEMSKMKGGKALGLDQCAKDFLRNRDGSMACAIIQLLF